MAIYHCKLQMIKRSSGRSAVAAAAYRSGERLHDDRTNEVHDYSKRSEVSHSEIIAPRDAPAWTKSRERLWNQAESAGRQWNEQPAREMLAALPRELTLDQQKALCRDLIYTNFTARGMVADFSIHSAQRENPHVHILLTTRELNQDGFGLKVREWNERGLCIEWRKSLAEITNFHLQLAGHDVRIDDRSLKDRGIDLTPGVHLGSELHALLQKGEIGEAQANEKYQQYLEIMQENGEKIIANPDIAVKKICQQQSVFSDYDIAKIANQHSMDLEQYQKVKEAVRHAPTLIELGQDAYKNPIYTSQETLEQEKKVLETAYSLQMKPGHTVSNEAIAKALDGKTLMPSQLDAFHHVTQEGDLKIVAGLAGTGKSFLMGRCKEAWEEMGYQVKGGALSGMVSQGLEESTLTSSPTPFTSLANTLSSKLDAALGTDAVSHISNTIFNSEELKGIESRTLDSWLYRWEQGNNILTKKDVFVLDEAGMVNTEKFLKIAEAVHKAGAKFVFIGDPEQAQPIGAGNPSKALINRTDSIMLTDIFRQNDPTNPSKTAEMKAATLEFGKGETEKALHRYKELGCIKGTAADMETAKQMMAHDWATQRQEGVTQIMMAHSNRDVTDLNAFAREIRIENGEIENGKTYQTENRLGKQERNFAVGDRMCFLQNDSDLGVKNGSFGTVQSINKNNFEVLLDGQKEQVAKFNMNHYNQVEHGYASTFHKAQGGTWDKAYMLGSKYMDRHLTYVGCTRHKIDLTIYSNQKDFGTPEALFKYLSEDRSKDFAMDFVKGTRYEQDDPYVLHSDRIHHHMTEQHNEAITSKLFEERGVKYEIAEVGEKIEGFGRDILCLEGGKQFMEFFDTKGGKAYLVEYQPGLEAAQGREAMIEVGGSGEKTSCHIPLEQLSYEERFDLMGTDMIAAQEREEREAHTEASLYDAHYDSHSDSLFTSSEPVAEMGDDAAYDRMSSELDAMYMDDQKEMQKQMEKEQTLEMEKQRERDIGDDFEIGL